MASEFERIARLKSLFGTCTSSAVQLGIGDDAAVLAPSVHPRVWTVDSAVQGIHFDTRFVPLEAVGYRAFMAAASDVAAMGGRAVAALSSLILPADLTDDALDALAAGLAAASTCLNCPIVGGNLARGTELSLTTSVLGECAGPVLTRNGARPGDAIFVTGSLGGAALGLRALSQGMGMADQVGLMPSMQRFLRPCARLDLAPDVAARAHACVDVSDGLVQDLMHVCRASGVAAELSLDRIPTPEAFQEGAQRLNLDASALVLSGGEDYELVFTAAEGSVPDELGTRIGRVVEGAPAVRVVDSRGAPLPPPAGFDHFR